MPRRTQADAISYDGVVRSPDPLIGAVLELLESGGHDAVQLREVARRAQMSLSTIYKRYATRDDLVVAALEWWMTENRYSVLERSNKVAPTDESLYDGLMRFLSAIFVPWEKNPEMLKAYIHVLSGPGGRKLMEQGFMEVLPVGRELLSKVDPDFARDIEFILSGTIFGLLLRLAAGDIGPHELMPAIERAVYWPTLGYENRSRTSAMPLPKSP